MLRGCAARSEGMHQSAGGAARPRLERVPSNLPLLRLDGPQVMPRALACRSDMRCRLWIRAPSISLKS
jgi:hypothetical protein